MLLPYLTDTPIKKRHYFQFYLLVVKHTLTNYTSAIFSQPSSPNAYSVAHES